MKAPLSIRFPNDREKVDLNLNVTYVSDIVELQNLDCQAIIRDACPLLTKDNKACIQL